MTRLAHYLIALAALPLLAACDTLLPSSMLTNGELHHFRADGNGDLRGPWYDAKSGVGVIRALGGHSDPATETPDEVFELVFNTGFVKYLPDFGGINEVIVVFTFEDGPIEKDEDQIVKILGPMRRQPDGSLLPDISRITFGPTALKSQYLSVDVKVIEFDQEEAEDTAAFIDFVGSAAQSLALADPVTAAEIRVVKEIGKFLVNTNQNDIILHTRFDLIPYDEDVWSRKQNAGATALPLRTGVFGVVKVEKPFQLFTFFPFTGRLDYGGGDPSTWGFWGDVLTTPFSLASDLVTLPITGVLRGFTDVPDEASMIPLQWDEDGLLTEATGGGRVALRVDPYRRQLEYADASTHFDAKTWLVFSVSQGHDAIPVAARDYMTESHKKIVEMLKRKSMKSIVEESDLLAAVEDLRKAREAVAAAQTVRGFKIQTPKGGKTETDKLGGSEVEKFLLELRTARDVKVEKLTLDPKKLSAASSSFSPVSVASTDAAVKTVANAMSWTLEKKTFPVGSYELTVEYTKGSSREFAKLPFEVVHTPTFGFDREKKLKKGEAFSLTLKDGSFEEVEEVEVVYSRGDKKEKTVTYKKGGAGIKVKVEEKSIELTVKGVGNEESVEVKSVTLKRGDLKEVSEPTEGGQGARGGGR